MDKCMLDERPVYAKKASNSIDTDKSNCEVREMRDSYIQNECQDMKKRRQIPLINATVEWVK